MDNSISINRVKRVLIASIQIDLSLETLVAFQNDLLEEVKHSDVDGVLIDLSGVKTLDRTAMDTLVDITQAVTVMGRKSVFVGIRPGIAMALVNIDYDTTKLNCVNNIDDGLAIFEM
ncbi:STAS domain-containing protein [Vibrio scophthalmi]|uniref:STAS domain-containing protein n=1 Tax=Vibrio scophthalmi TaxID=45658 RepID=UPI002FEFDC50